MLNKVIHKNFHVEPKITNYNQSYKVILQKPSPFIWILRENRKEFLWAMNDIAV